MLTGSSIATAYQTQLRLIPSLVTLMGGTASRIVAHDGAGSLMNDLQQMTAPGILIAYQGVAPGRLSQMEVWQHTTALYVRVDGDASAILAAIVNGVPTGSSFKMRLLSILSGLMPMDTPSMFRRTQQIGDSAFLDYWEIQIVNAENGDN